MITTAINSRRWQRLHEEQVVCEQSLDTAQRAGQPVHARRHLSDASLVIGTAAAVTLVIIFIISM